MTNDQLDFVIYGATGFTGKLVVEYVSQKYSGDSSINWAIAGRDVEKLKTIRDELKLDNDIKIFHVDSGDNESIQKMVDQSKCILTTVGPYQLYGSNILKACATSGTDYVDLCGEAEWMHRMIAEFSAEAKKTGSRIVFSCGFDSIPFDLGVHFVQQEAFRRFNEYAPKVRGRVREMKGEFSGGTAASMKATMSSLRKSPEIFEVLINPHALCEGFVGVEQENDSKPKFDKKLNTWVAPFFMAPINTKNIHRTNKLLGHKYGEDFKYNEMWIAGPGEEGKKLANILGSANPIIGDNVPEPGEGPSKESRENGSYDLLFCADFPEKEVSISVQGDMDPGYGSTSKMIAESAICLVKEMPNLEGGVYTPASSMGSRLIRRLEENAGLTFRVEES